MKATESQSHDLAGRRKCGGDFKLISLNETFTKREVQNMSTKRVNNKNNLLIFCLD